KFMRTATLFLLFATIRVFAAPQDPIKAKQEPATAPAPRFEAIPPNVTPGQTAQLTWTVEGATSVTIDPVIGTVPASGSAPVSPAETTTYKLTAVMPSGNITATATITVGPAAPTGEGEVKTPATIPAETA